MTKDIKDSNELLTNGKLREKLVGRIEVLDHIKGLLMLSNTELATVKQVANFYEVDETAIQILPKRFPEELKSDGYRVENRSSLISLLSVQDAHLENVKGKTIVTLPDGNEVLEIPNRGLRIFPRRAILRVGMLLTDSPIVQEVRNQLLNIEEKTSV